MKYARFSDLTLTYILPNGIVQSLREQILQHSSSYWIECYCGKCSTEEGYKNKIFKIMEYIDATDFGNYTKIGVGII